MEDEEEITEDEPGDPEPAWEGSEMRKSDSKVIESNVALS